MTAGQLLQNLKLNYEKNRFIVHTIIFFVLKDKINLEK
jgi:hypothetical protein